MEMSRPGHLFFSACVFRTRIIKSSAVYHGNGLFVMFYDFRSEESHYDAMVCRLAGPEQGGMLPAVFRRAIAWLFHSPTGEAMLSFAVRHGVKLDFDEMAETDVNFNARTRRIELTDDFSSIPPLFAQTGEMQGNFVISLTRGLRMAWQHMRGHSATLGLDARDYVRLLRAQEADAWALAVLVCWELRLEGVMEPWRQMLAGSEGDIAMAFETAINFERNDGYTANALRSAYDQWFADHERSNHCDHRALEMIDGHLDLQSPPGERPRRRFFARLSRRKLEHVGRTPDGSNYLQATRMSDIKDTYYSHIHDDINRAHLQHILRDLSAREPMVTEQAGTEQ